MDNDYRNRFPAPRDEKYIPYTALKGAEERSPKSLLIPISRRDRKTSKGIDRSDVGDELDC